MHYFGNNSKPRNEKTIESIPISINAVNDCLPHNYYKKSGVVQEHCLTVENAKHFFDKEPKMVDRRSRMSLKKVSSFDIFSGKIVDPDIPPIEADVEEPGVYKKHAEVDSPSQNHLSIKERLSFRRKNQTAQQKRGKYRSPNSSFNTTIKDAEKENKEVIIRMRDQERYYDSKEKYQSVLPDMPSRDEKHSTTSVQMRQQSVEELIDNDSQQEYKERENEKVGSRRREAMQNSVLIGDQQLPSIAVSTGKTDNVAQKWSSTMRESVEEMIEAEVDDDDDDDVLEPGGYGLGDSVCEYSNVAPGTSRTLQLLSQPDENGHMGPTRVTWKETEEGKKLISFKKLPKEVIKWQEQQFEIISTEAKYYKSITDIVNLIYKHPLLSYLISDNKMDVQKNGITSQNNSFNIEQSQQQLELQQQLSQQQQQQQPDQPPQQQKPLLTATDKHSLFSNILEIHICSGNLLRALEEKWKENPFLEDLGKVFIDFYESGKFAPYVTYMQNQKYQTDTLNKLLAVTEFKDLISDLLSQPRWEVKDLGSLLLKPAQRPFQMNLLIKTAGNGTPDDYVKDGYVKAYKCLLKLLAECNEGKVWMDQKEILLGICNRLRFPEGHSTVGLGGPLLYKDWIPLLTSNTGLSKRLVNLYVFSDQIIIASKLNDEKTLPLCFSSRSSEEKEVVLDRCPRAQTKFCVEMSQVSGSFSGPSKIRAKLQREADKERSGNIHGKISEESSSDNGTWQFWLYLDSTRRKVRKSKSVSVSSNNSNNNNTISAKYLFDVKRKEDLDRWERIFSKDDDYLDTFAESSKAVVLEDFEASEDNQLGVRKDQIVNIIGNLHQSTYGMIMVQASGREGLVPLSVLRFAATAGIVPLQVTKKS